MLLKVFKKLYTFQTCLKSDKIFNEITIQMLSKLQVFKKTYNCFFLPKTTQIRKRSCTHEKDLKLFKINPCWSKPPLTPH